METIEEITKIAIDSLNNAAIVHDKLGKEGLKKVKKNQHGDLALTGDIQTEKAVIKILKESKIPLKIISEEHGEINLSKKPKYLVVLDGIDGTKEYKKSIGKGRYGTILGIFSNLNPSYQDYLFGGMVELSSKKIFYVSKDRGSYVISKNNKNKIKSKNLSKLTKKTKIYADFEFDKNRGISFIKDTFISKLENYNFLYETSMGVHLIDIATGKADLALHSSRKGNLEIAAAYGIIKEAGGIVVDIKGEDIAKRKYLKFGQKKFIPIISASSKRLAKELIKKINKK